MRWDEAVQAVQLGEGERWLWSARTGRGLRRPEMTEAELEHLLGRPAGMPLKRRFEELGLLGDARSVDWIPVRSRWALLRPDDQVLWHACPLERGHGGYPFRAMVLGASEVAMWRHINGARPLSRIASDLGLSQAQVWDFVGRLTVIEVQAAQLRMRPVGAQDPSLARLVAPPRPRHARTADQFDGSGTTRLEAYHQGIATAERHFDDRETTFAHVFTDPHPALDNRPFGAALRHALEAVWGPCAEPVLEVGPGSGAVCAAWRPESPEAYWRLDLSEALLNAQASRCPGTRSIVGSATAMPLEDGSVGWVISNEVLADLPAGSSPGSAAITPMPGQTVFNLGAFEMVREVARVLRPGGRAYVSEFGGPEEHPTETAQLDHPEVSIHFGQVAEAAVAQGLVATLCPLADLLRVDREALWLSRPSYEAIRAWFASRGEPLSARAYHPGALPEGHGFEDLWWVGVGKDGPGPRLDRLWCVLLEKPVGPTSPP